MLAMEAGFEDLAFLFLEMGADLEQTCNGKGLVWYAVWHSCANILKYLLEGGCSATDDTSLLTAVSGVLAGRVMAHLLLDADAGARIEQQDEQGRTPLRIAYEDGDKDKVELLLERGASMEGAKINKDLLDNLDNPFDILL